MPEEWRIVATTSGHREHRDVKNVDCLSCHGPSTHVSEPAAAVCAKCHADQHLHDTATATIGGAETCLSCHGFAVSPKNAQVPTPVACAKCHADPTELAARSPGKEPLRAVGDGSLHGRVPCQLCHNAHGIEPKVPEGQPACFKCHQRESFPAEIAAAAGTDAKVDPSAEGHRGRCEGCHRPHAPKGSAIDRCVGCHEKNAKGLLPNGEAVKTTALRHDGCATCHVPHTWKPEPTGCMGCHKDEARLFQDRSPPQHASCTTCHDVHGAPPSGAVCVKCHADPATFGKHAAVAPERHKDCTTCHDPHAPKPEDTRRVCAKCHSTEATQIARDGPAGHRKDGCFACHAPHDDPMPRADVCATCHEDKAGAIQAAAPPKHRECTSCHQKHEFRVSDVASACSTCHAALFDTEARGLPGIAHRAECKDCHTVHGEPGVPQAACLKCHEKVQGEFHPSNDKHADCRSCHESHAPAAAAPARCRSCHADKAAVAAQWPSASAHAAACTSCHEPHDVKSKKACSDCHAAEAKDALGGKHQCAQCHAPHAAPPGEGAAWWQRCASCHATQVEGAKTRGPTHAQCKNCHQPHRFDVPTCTSCHADIATKGLHAVQQHTANCGTCHDPHVKAPPARAQCLTCHKDRQAHEPDAPRCSTCHSFR
jgi:hypothetical protein